MATLVTGGAGYVGSHVARALLSAGRDIVVLDSLRSGSRSAVQSMPLVVGDVRDGTLIRQIMDDYEVDTVIHMAALKSVADSVTNPLNYFSNNVIGSLELIGACVERSATIVYSSTCAVYGDVLESPVDESAPIHPLSPYAESKATIERVLEWMSAAGQIRFIALRYFNAAGADPDGQFGEDWSQAESLIPTILRVAYGLDDRVNVYGTDYATPDGTAIRDYIHVTDLAVAHTLALGHLEAGGESQTLNLGTGTGKSVLEVIRGAEAVTKRSIAIQNAPRRAGDLPAVWADPDRAQRVLGWQAQHDLRAILESAWAWHVSQMPDHTRAHADS